MKDTNKSFYLENDEVESVVSENDETIRKGEIDSMMLMGILPTAEHSYIENNSSYKCVDRYLLGETLGSGSYGKVRAALDTEFLVKRAIKIMRYSSIRRIPEGEEAVKRFTNVLKQYDVMSDSTNEKVYIVLEYCVCSLMDLICDSKNIKNCRKLPLWQSQKYFRHLINGLEYLHSNGVIHKDIKPANLLVSMSDELKITDFGVSEKLDLFKQDDMIEVSQGSPAFQSPEVAASKIPFSGFKLDIWGSGMTLYYMTTGCFPFERGNIFKLYEDIAKCEIVFPTIENDDSNTTDDILKKILTKDPSIRIDLQEIKNHRFYKYSLPRIGKPIKYSLECENSNNDKLGNTLFNKLKYFIKDKNSETEISPRKTPVRKNWRWSLFSDQGKISKFDGLFPEKSKQEKRKSFG